MPRLPQPANIYIGIDPGIKGGIVAISNSGYLEATPMPATMLDTWHAIQRITNHAEALGVKVFAVLEQVHSMPKQSSQSSFTFGRGVGWLEGFLTGTYTPFTSVTPQAWMKEFGMKRIKDESDSKWKGRLRQTAQQLFPALSLWSVPKSLGKQLAVSDALLIAEFCRRRYAR